MISRTKILFMAWGHSIHAQRRIGLFTEDPRFDTAVISTYPYDFPGARNIYLTAAHSAQRVGGSLSPVPPAEPGKKWHGVNPLKALYRLASRAPVVGTPLHEAVTSTRDFATLRRAVKSFKPDVIFLQTLMYPSYLALALPRRIPQIITFWNGDVVWWAKLHGAEKLFKRQIVTTGVRRASAITVNSETARAACLDYGADPGRVHLIRYPGVKLADFADLDRPAAKRRLGFTGPVILSQRGPAPYQNLETLVDAAPRILASIPSAVFVFLSPGQGHKHGVFARFQKRAEQLGVNHAMRWVGNVPHDETRLYLAAADAAVTISSEDSLPNSMLEAMAARVPVIAGNIAPIREWVTDGETGLMADPRDSGSVGGAILRVLSSSDLRNRLTDRAYALVHERASYETQVPALKKLVLSIAGH
jgi:glycosyltransferase involved in cell wall biosynthesis